MYTLGCKSDNGIIVHCMPLSCLWVLCPIETYDSSPPTVRGVPSFPIHVGTEFVKVRVAH